MKELCSDKILALSASAKSGDRNALNVLYEQYHVQVCHFIKRMLSGCSIYDASAAEHILHNSWEYLNKNIDKLDLNYENSFRNFFYSTSKFIFLQHMRKIKDDAKNISLDADEIKFKIHTSETPETIYIDKNSNRFEIHDIILATLFNKTGKPHQIIAFCFNKLIYPAKYNTLNGSPIRIVNELSDKTLINLANLFKTQYSQYSYISIDKIDTFMLPLFDAIKKHEAAEKRLQDYYVKDANGKFKDPPCNIRDWSDKVRGRLLRHVIKNYKDEIKIKYSILLSDK